MLILESEETDHMENLSVDGRKTVKITLQK
jgi:hypothetical protein